MSNARLVIDFETYYTSAYSLSRMSTQEYIRDPRFQAIGAAVRWPNETRSIWYVDDELTRAMREIKRHEQDLFVVAHSCNFDGAVLSMHYGINPAHLGCTLGMANALGLGLACGGSLARLTEVFQRAGYPLRSKGNEVVAAMGKRREDFTDSELAAYGSYCRTDNDNCHAFAEAFIPLLPPDELLWQSQVLKMHTAPRMRVDGAVVAGETDRVRLKRQAALDKLRARLSLSYLDDELLRKLVASRPKLAEILDGLGVSVPTKISPATGAPTPALSKKDPQFLALLNHPDDMVRAVVEARLELASSIEKSRCEQFARLAKLPAFSAPYKISGAHTHRLGGSDGINLQNMTSGRKAGQSDALKRSIIPLDPGEVFVGADSSQVEVRTLDYAADDWSGLEDFRKGVCPYSRLAAKMWPTEGIDAAEVKRLAKLEDELWAKRRQIAKAVVLACFDASTTVLTDRGAVRIVDVQPTDKLWDGQAWVTCGGVAARGARMTVEFAGTRVSPDHLVLTDGGWVEVQDAVELDVVDFGERHLPHPLRGQRGSGHGHPALDTERGTVRQAEDAEGLQLRPVFDLVNCGPRNRFTVIGADGQVFIAHNCGFGQGGAGFKVYAETQANLVFTDDEALGYVKQYREAKPRVVQFWRQCDRVLQALINGQRGEFGGPDGKLFHFDGARRVLGVHLPGIRLPNGTWLSYPNIRNTTVRELNEETGEHEERKVVAYDNAKGRSVEQRFTWGGTLTENLVQALAFAVMKWQAGEEVFLQHGLVLNCHDAHATIAPRAQAEQVKREVLAALSQCPPWAPGIPLGAEAAISETMAGVI